MSYRPLLLGLALSVVSVATGCEWLDESCPDGYWRRRAGEECEPLPDLDAGADAGGPTVDAGPPDSGTAAEDASVLDGAIDAAASGDAAAPIDAASDASTDAAADAS